MTWFLLFSVGLYVILLGLFAIGFFRLKSFVPVENESKTTFSLVVPFRDEEKNIGQLMNSIANLNYPETLLEVLFVNDASKDASVAVIQEYMLKNKIYNWNVLNNERKSHSPKKDAITVAISKSKNNWIFTTDADCILPENLLKDIDLYIQHTPSKLITGPVLVIPENRFFISHYQFLESLTLAGITMGSFGINLPIMCNGAHLAYEKSAFTKVNGFEGNNHIASGDDLFLLQKMKAVFPDEVHFLKKTQHIVSTKTEAKWPAVVQQRVRWAAKTADYKSLFSKTTGIVVLAANVSVIVAFVMLFKSENESLFLLLILLKWGIDEFFIYQTNTFLKREIHWIYLRLMAFLYPILTVYIALKALFGKYNWKGRTFKK